MNVGKVWKSFQATRHPSRPEGSSFWSCLKHWLPNLPSVCPVPSVTICVCYPEQDQRWHLASHPISLSSTEIEWSEAPT